MSFIKLTRGIILNYFDHISALYFYDCLLMLSTEKDGVWKDFETSVASLTFLVNRYGWFAFMVTEVSIGMRWESWTTNIVRCAFAR